MVGLDRFLGFGYLPAILPPPFVSEDFGTHSASIAQQWVNPNVTLPATSSRATRVNVEDRPGHRRTFHIPNPLHQLLLANTLSDNWSALEQFFDKTIAYGATRPVEDDENRATKFEHGFNQWNEFTADLAVGQRYMVKSDISSFFPTLYTHAIPWALHGKSTAKANIRNHTMLGNQIDIRCRNTMEQQTLGIPIGPDTSAVLAEIVAAALDREIASKVGSVRGFRYVDDFRVFTRTKYDAELVLAAISEAASDFELELNDSKTEIVEIPFALEPIWVNRLRRCRFRKQAKSQRLDIVAYFSLMYSLSREYPSDGVIRYGIRRIHSIQFAKSNWNLFSTLLLESATAEPSVLPDVVKMLWSYVSDGFARYPNTVYRFVTDMLEYHAPLGHNFECAWSLWLLKTLGIKLRLRQAERLARMEDPIIGLVLLDMVDSGLVIGSPDLSPLDSMATPSDLYGENWIFAYEASLRGWVSPASGNPILSDPFFAALGQYPVHFYEATRQVAVTALQPPGTENSTNGWFLYH